jgi:hypothetical protein
VISAYSPGKVGIRLVFPVGSSEMAPLIVYRLLNLSRTKLSVSRRRVKQFVQHEGEEPDGQARYSNPVIAGDD